MTHYDDTDNQYPPQAIHPAVKSAMRKPPFQTPVKLGGWIEGAYVEVAATVDIALIPRLVVRLQELGMSFDARPIRFDLTAEGQPICPKHRVPMRKRGKQGDAWYSHQTIDDLGESKWCRGYDGPSSEGYHCEHVYTEKAD